MPSLFFLLFLIANTISVVLCNRETYIIHMDSNNMPTPYPSHQTWYSSILTSAQEEKTSPETQLLLYTYTKAACGFSAKLSPSELRTIREHPLFLSATRDMPLKLATSHSTEFLGLNSISGAWPATDFGRDVIIGVVDSGTWPESKSFNDDGMGAVPKRWNGGCYGGSGFNSSFCNKKLIGVRFFNKGQTAANPNVMFLDSARDAMGHGTHVSSVAAGNYIQGATYFGYASGTAKGMSPRAHLAVYKAAYNDGDDLYASDVIAAIDAAIHDRVDIISLSIASNPLLYQDPVAIATFAAMENGIFVSSAAGNWGPSLKTIMNGAPWVLSVAAGTIDRSFVGTVVLGNGASITGSSFYPLDKTPAPNLSAVYLKTCSGLTKYELLEIKNKIVVCPTTFEDDTYSVFDSGVAGAVLIWNVSNAFNVPDLPDDGSQFPAVFISIGNGKIIQDYIEANHKSATVTLFFKETVHGTRPAPKVAEFSSRGPSPSCPFLLKPDVMAPGYNILASWQEAKPADLIITGDLFSRFKIVCGTSMASPHVAGAAGLLKAAHPDWSPTAIKSAIMTTANKLDNMLNQIQEKGSNQTATPLAIGSGHIDPNKALSPGLVYDAGVDDYVNLLCAMKFTSKQIHVITRVHRSCKNATLDFNYPSFMAYFDCNGTKSVQFQRTLTNVGDEMSSYKAKVVAMEPFNVRVMPERLVFRKKGDKMIYQLKIDGPCLSERTVVHGSVSWLEIGGKKSSVVSPIVVVGFSPDLIS